MSLALNLAKQGQYTVHPNPAVGCVVVKNNEIVGQGWHERAGEAHAEIQALADAGKRSRGATLYVTLEPCNHTGRTPPCTDAVIRSGISRVVVASKDPNPLVQGRGLQALEEAGIEVVTGICTETATCMNRGFFKRMTTNMPFVILKIASSLDGRIAMANGESRWITSEESRCDVHRLRALSSAVLTGIGTVQKDDPLLTVRHLENSRQPDRVVLDSQLSISPKARILEDSAKVYLFTTKNNERSKQLASRTNLEIISSQSNDDQVELVGMLKECGKRQMNIILVEAGPRLAGNFLKQGLVDELVLYLAPSFLGNDALAMINLPGIGQLTEKIQMRISCSECLGPDLKMVLVPVDHDNI